jgi:hypothetical protein
MNGACVGSENHADFGGLVLARCDEDVDLEAGEARESGKFRIVRAS